MLNFSRKNIFRFIAVIGLLLFLHLIGILSPVESVVRQVIEPILSNLYSLSSSLRTSYNDSTSKKDLQNEINQLEAKVNQLTVENVGLKKLEEENNILREHLKFTSENEYNYLLANVISRGELTDLPVDSEILIINKGSQYGIQPGAPVVSSQGIIVGKIAEVKTNISKVILTTDRECRLAATVQNKDKTTGIAEGDLGLTILMNFIPQTEEIKVGDAVVTSGLEEYIPRGLVIGNISKVDRESNEVWQKAAIEPLVEFDNLVIVSVLILEKN